MFRYGFAVLALTVCAACPIAEAQDSDKLTQTITDTFRGCFGGVGTVKGGNMTEADLPGIGLLLPYTEATRIETPAGRLFQYKARRGGIEGCGVAYYGTPPSGLVDIVSALIKSDAGLVEQNEPASWIPAAHEMHFGPPRPDPTKFGPQNGCFCGVTILIRDPSNDAPSFQAHYSQSFFH